MNRIAVVVAIACIVILPAPFALGAEDGTLVVVPAEGTLDTPIDVITAGECPRGVTFVVAVRGAGIDPATAGNAVGNTSLDVLQPPIHPGRHTVPLARTLREFFIGNGLSASRGDYELVFACRNRLDFEDLYTFTGTITISKDRYQAKGSAATPLEEWLALTPDSTAASTNGDAPASANDVTAVTESAQAGSDSSKTPAEVSDVASSDTSQGATESGVVAESGVQAVAATAGEGGDQDGRLLLAVGGVVLLGVAAFAWWRQSRTPS